MAPVLKKPVGLTDGLKPPHKPLKPGASPMTPAAAAIVKESNLKKSGESSSEDEADEPPLSMQ